MAPSQLQKHPFAKEESPGGLYAPALAVAALVGLWILSQHNYLLFHVIVELFSVAVACGVFFVAWHTRPFLASHYLPLLGIGFLHVALLDTLHAIAYKGMGVFTDHGANLATQLWIAGRGMETLTIVAALLGLRWRFPLTWVGALVSAVTALLLLAIFTGLFPDCYIEGLGLTSFKITSEYLICLVLLIAAWLYWRQRDRFHPDVFWRLQATILLTIAAELSFTAYFSVYDFANFIGHYFKLVSYFLVYQVTIVTGLSRPYLLLFKELKDGEEAQRRSHEQFLAVIEGLAVGVFVAELDSCRILYANRYLKKIYGLDLEGRRCHEAILGRNESRCELCDPGRLVVNDKAVDAEASEWFNPMNKRWYLKQERAIRWLDQQWARLQILTDITPLKESQELREDIERITRHDLKSPLNGILNLPELIIADNNLTQEQRECLELIKNAGHRMLVLINQSLDLYKMERGVYESHPTPVDLRKLFEHLRMELDGQLRSRRIELLIQADGQALAPSAPFLVLGEELLCHSLFGNLLNNAMDASKPGGQIRVQLQRDTAGDARVSIWNEKAIPPAIRDRFMHKYVTAGKRHGTGLGAYSARLMTEVQNGQITWLSSDAAGTTITVTLPTPRNNDPDRTF